MVDLSIVTAQFAITGFKIETALRDFTEQSITVLSLELCDFGGT